MKERILLSLLVGNVAYDTEEYCSKDNKISFMIVVTDVNAINKVCLFHVDI